MERDVPEARPSDQHLFASARAGDAAAFSVLVERHYRAVWGLASSRMGDREAAEDVAQEAFLVAYANRERLRDPRLFPAWLRKITRHLASHWLRSEKYRRLLHEGLARERGLETSEEDPVTNMVREEKNAEVWDALNRLSPGVREAMVLFYVEGRSTVDAARSLGVSENAIRTRLYQGRRKMRSDLEARLERELSRRPPKETTARIRSLLALGPAVPLAGARAARCGFELWAHGVRHSGGAAPFVKATVLAAMLAIAAAGSLGVYVGTKPRESEVTSPAETTKVETAAVVPLASETLKAQAAQAPPEVAEPPDDLANEPGYIAEPALACSISGRVLDVAGQGIPDAFVMVVVSGYDEDAYRGDNVITSHTFHAKRVDPRHHFTAFSDAAGNYTVDGIRFSGTAVVKAYKRGYHSDHALPPLHAGEALSGVDLTVSPGKLLVGRVVAPDGSPLTDAVVECTWMWEDPQKRRGSSAGLTYTDEHGGFWLGYMERMNFCNLFVESPAQGRSSFLSVPIGDEPVELVMQPAAGLRGEILRPDGTPAAGYRVLLRGLLYFPVPEGRAGHAASEYEAQVDDAGRYEIPDVDPGQTYSVCITDASFDFASMQEELPRFGPGETAEWSFRLKAPMRVHGHVRGAHWGRPARDVQVHYQKQGEPPRGDTIFPPRVRVDENGAYGFKLLRGTGRYSFTPEYLGLDPATTTHARELHLAEGQDVTLDLILPDPVTISVRLLDADGRPCRGVFVAVRQAGHDGRRWHVASGATDPDGRYSFAGFAPDFEGWLECRSEGFAPAKSSRYLGSAGQVFPEETLVLHRAAGAE